MDDNYQPRCPLPVYRMQYTDDGEEKAPSVERCKGIISVIRTSGGTFFQNELDEEAVHWKVECEMGHVLFVPDDEGNGLDRLMPSDELILHVIAGMNVSLL